jgi:hypothetical protein
MLQRTEEMNGDHKLMRLSSVRCTEERKAKDTRLGKKELESRDPTQTLAPGCFLPVSFSVGYGSQSILLRPSANMAE